GGVLSGGLTYATLRVQSGRLITHLRALPPPHVDAEEYLRLLHVADGVAEDRAASTVSSLRESKAPADGDGEALSATQHAAVALKDGGSAAKDAAAKVTGRIGGMIPRRVKREPAGGADA